MPKEGAVGIRDENEVGALVWVREDRVQQLLVDSQTSVLAEDDGTLGFESMSNLLDGGDGGEGFASDEKGFDGLLLFAASGVLW